MSVERKRREVPQISSITLRFFQRIVRVYFRRHFRSVMVQHAERFEVVDGPLIVYANHSSWWDPMVSVLLAQALLPGRKHYAPMDASALERYPILRRIGIFPVEMSTARGAAQFLRTSQEILERGDVLWVTPQGRFADPRVLPLAFKPGLGALAVRTQATLMPLAIEYAFWDERLPETLLHIGEGICIESGTSIDDATHELEKVLGEAMERLKVACISRDAHVFRVLLTGGRGTGGFYGLGRKFVSVMRGKRVRMDHTERPVISPKRS